MDHQAKEWSMGACPGCRLHSHHGAKAVSCYQYTRTNHAVAWTLQACAHTNTNKYIHKYIRHLDDYRCIHMHTHMHTLHRYTINKMETRNTIQFYSHTEIYTCLRGLYFTTSWDSAAPSSWSTLSKCCGSFGKEDVKCSCCWGGIGLFEPQKMDFIWDLIESYITNNQPYDSHMIFGCDNGAV